MAEILSHDELPFADIADVRRMLNTNVYGNPGPQARLNAVVRDADGIQLRVFLSNLDYLLWGEDPDEVRISRLLDSADRGIPGLGESVIVKLLSLAHPEQWVPMFPYTGPHGKRHHVRVLGLEPPDPTLTPGELQARSNGLIRERLDHFFPNDPWGSADVPLGSHALLGAGFRCWRRGRG